MAAIILAFLVTWEGSYTATWSKRSVIAGLGCASPLLWIVPLVTFLLYSGRFPSYIDPRLMRIV
jgi:hypothetical protein